jgi:hypothetical protein
LDVRRQITPEEKIIFSRISASTKKKSFISNLIKSEQVSSEIFLIGEVSSIGSIRYIAPYILHSNTKVKDLAVNQIHKLISSVSDLDLNWLDESIRGGHYFDYDSNIQRAWYQLTPEQISTLDFSKPHLISVLKVLSCHSSGFVREASIKKLINLDKCEAIKLLIIRANDWVKPLRELSTTSLKRLFKEVEVENLVNYVPNIEQLRNRQRNDNGKLIKDFENYFTNEESGSLLLNALNTTDYRAARASLKIVIRLVEDKKAIIDSCINNTDTIIRSRALSIAIESINQKELIVYLKTFSKDKSNSIRKQAVYRLIDLDFELARPVLIDFLTGNNKSIREFARFYLSRNDTFDFGMYYREHIQIKNNPRLANAISGLAETGDLKDWKFILEFENHKLPKVQSSVVLASAKLMEQPNSWLYEKLLCSNFQVSKAARNALVAIDDYATKDIVKLHKNNWRGVIGKRLRQLVERNDKWQSIILILESILNSGSHDYSELKRWLQQHNTNCCFVKPSAQILNEVIRLSELVNQTDNVVTDVSTLHEFALRLLNTDM